MADALQLLPLGVPAKSRVGGNFSIAVFSIIIDKYLSDFLWGIFAFQFFLVRLKIFSPVVKQEPQFKD